MVMKLNLFNYFKDIYLSKNNSIYQSFSEKNFVKKRRAISPLIATILLIVVSVAIIGILISWGKGFTIESLSSSSAIEVYTESEHSFYINISNSINGRTTISYNPPEGSPFNDLNIIGYGLLGYIENIVPLEPTLIISKNQSINIDHGIILPEIDLVLYLDNERMITKQNIKQTIKQPSSCPEGYIPVPGNHLYGTMNERGGFCVSKYEMKMDISGDGIGDLVSSYPDCNTGNLSTNTLSYEWCSGLGDIVSTKEGSPVTRISQTQAISACQESGGNLISNNQWMTIVRNIELISNNWSSGQVGEGYIFSGHNDSSPTRALEASIDTNGYFDTNNTDNNQRRTLYLNNNQVIWDLSGNVFTWTNDLIAAKDQPDAFLTADDSEYNGGFPAVSPYYLDLAKTTGGSTWYLNPYNLGNTTLKYKDLYLLTNPYYSFENSIGKTYTDSNRSSTTETLYPFIKGGYWADSTSSGVLATIMDHPASLLRFYTGFRCVN